MVTYQQGEFDSLDEKINQTDSIRYKNSFMIPLFARIKGLVAHLKNDQEKQLIEEYEVARNIVLKNYEVDFYKIFTYSF